MSRPEPGCDCGRPLHYVDAQVEVSVRRLVSWLGPLITVQVGSHAWRVPRHYIALHGLAATDVPQLAVEHDWSQLY